MKSFTYYDYIKCIHTLRLNAIFRLAEEGNEYNLGTKEKTEEDFLLGNKEEVSKLINTFLNPNKKVLANDLIKYKNKNIERKYRKNPIKAIYKIRNEEKYYLIDYTDNLNTKEEYKILNYCIDIIYEWSKHIKKEENYPLIIPIIIYVGTDKWKREAKEDEKTVSFYVQNNYDLKINYNVIEINKYSDKFLLQKKTLFGYRMFLEKAKGNMDLKRRIEKIITICTNKKQMECIKENVFYLIKKSMEKALKKEINLSKEECNLSTLYERLIAEYKKDIEMTKKDEKKNIAKKLLENKVSEEIILNSTKISKKELEECKNKINY